MIDVHARAVARGPAAEHAGRLQRQMIVAQLFPFDGAVEPLDQAGDAHLRPRTGRSSQVSGRNSSSSSSPNTEDRLVILRQLALL